MLKSRAFQLAAAAVAAFSLSLLIVETTVAQRGPGRGPGRGPAQPGRGPGAREEAEAPKTILPEDEKMRELYLDFFAEAKKLAEQYERENKPDKAREVYSDLSRMFPSYKQAEQKLAELDEREATADRKTVTIAGNVRWQDTGIMVTEGKPLRFSTDGRWHMKLDVDVDGNGLASNDELVPSARLGSLVGQIIVGKGEKPVTFAIGKEAEIRPSVSGRLMLQMNDADLSDNGGRLTVIIQGTFKRN